jgi:hypothetical protein
MVRQRPDLTLVPPAALRLNLDSAQPTVQRKTKGTSRTGAPSWWTSRARETEIKPGFTKQEILKPAKDDPRATGGIFERVGGILSELIEQG